MKKLVFVAILLSLTVVAFAQTSDTASITLQGTVEKRVAVTATGTGNFDDLDLETDVTDLAVVTVNEYSNVREGYTVSLQSANAAAGGTSDPYFEGQSGGETLTYSITYEGSAVTFSGGTSQITDSNAKTSLAGTDKTLAINYSASTANLGNDTYQDDLTFTITAK